MPALCAAEDAEAYFTQNFCPLDAETARMTGSKSVFMREEIDAYFARFADGKNGCLFLLLNVAGEILGESVINEIDGETRCANFRIAMFRPASRGKGLGTWMSECVRDFAFEVLKLHRLELDVFSFHPRARHMYEKVGFRVEGVRRDAILDGDGFADGILMAMLEDEWRAIKHIK